nr:hypothetical protein [Tanacetum cinerariifolium]
MTSDLPILHYTRPGSLPTIHMIGMMEQPLRKASTIARITLIRRNSKKIFVLFKVKAKAKMGKKDMKDPVPRDLPVVQPYVPTTPFPGHLKKLKDNPYKTRKTVCKLGSL